MREEFVRRRGYDMTPFLPVFTGRVVESPEVSERFLWDLRRTISELVVEDYAGRFRDLVHAAGMRFTVEAYGSPCDYIPYGGQADEPMGEFWTPSGGAMGTCRGMASAGHLYGKPIIGAEAFTANDHERWREHPAMLKALGDQAFCEGINRFVFHRYAMQPWPDRQPGMTMGPLGPALRAHTDLVGADTCLARVPGALPVHAPARPVRRGCAFSPSRGPPTGLRPAQPCRLRLGRVQRRCGLHAHVGARRRIVLPDGMSYRLLVLSDTQTTTPRLLQKLKELVEAGATLVGPRPLKSPSLNSYPQCDEEVQRLGGQIWGTCDGKQVHENRLGKGRVFWDLSPDQVLQRDGVGPDFACDRKWRFIHRTADDAEIYFVASDEPFEATTTCSFRVTGSTPELWYPETGEIEQVAAYQQVDGATHIPLTLEPCGSVFVVFREVAENVDPVTLVQTRRQDASQHCD